MRIQNIGLNTIRYQKRDESKSPKNNFVSFQAKNNISADLGRLAEINKATIIGLNKKNIDVENIKELNESNDENIKEFNKIKDENKKELNEINLGGKTLRRILKDGSELEVSYKNGKISLARRTKATPEAYEEEVKRYVYENDKLKKVLIARETQIAQVKDGVTSHPFAFFEDIEIEREGDFVVTRNQTTRVDNNTGEERTSFVERRRAVANNGTILNFYTQETENNKVENLEFKTPDGIQGRYDIATKQIKELVFPQDKRGVTIKISRIEGKDDEFYREVQREQGFSALEHWKGEQLLDVMKKRSSHCKVRQTLDYEGHVSVQYCNSDWDRIYADATLGSKTQHVPNYPLNNMSVSETIKLYEGFVSKVVDSVN